MIGSKDEAAERSGKGAAWLEGLGEWHLLSALMLISALLKSRHSLESQGRHTES